MIWRLRSNYWTMGKDGRVEEFVERSQCALEPLADAWMGRAIAHCHMLAVELDARRPYGVSLLSLMARVCAGGGCAGGGSHGVFDVDAVAERVRAPVCGFFTRLVDV
jgi:putative N-acetylmannosamine-6-phosphate epimerase